MQFFDVSFWQQLITTAIGTGAGFFLAIKWDYRRQVLSNAADIAAMKSAIQTAMTNAEGMLGELLDELSLRPTYIRYRDAIDVALLDATSDRKYQLLAIPICARIDRVRFQLGIINDRLRRINTSLRLIENSLNSRSEFEVFQGFLKGEVAIALSEIKTVKSGL